MPDDQRKRLRTLAEQLVRRVHALDGRMYAGAGFHYCLVRQAHSLMVQTDPERWHERWDKEDPPETRHIITQVAAEGLLRSVQRAEVSAIRWERKGA
jgi:hypothetical protein